MRLDVQFKVMTRKASIMLVFLLTTITTSVFADETVNLESMLQNADALKSANPQLFSQKLVELEEFRDSLSTNQSDFLDYLHGYHQAFMGNFEISENIYIDIFMTTNDVDLKFKVGYSLFNVYALGRKFNKGMKYLNQSLALLPKVQNKEYRITGILAAMMFYNELGEYKKVLDLEKRVWPENPEGRNLCAAHTMLTRAKYHLDMLRNQDEEFHKAINICHAQNEPLYESLNRMHYVRMFIDVGELEKAKQELKDHIDVALASKYKLVIREYYYLIAAVYWQLEQLELAKKYALMALDQNISTPFSLPLTMTYKILYEIEKTSGNHEQALRFFEKYAEADKAYLNDVQMRKLAVELAETEFIEKNRRIQLLNQENKVLVLEQKLDAKTREQNRIVILAMFFLITLLGIWGWRTKLIQKRFQRIAQIDELTGIFNRRQFTDLSAKGIDFARSAKQVNSVIIFDLDKFKSINDNYGHPVGDWVLKAVADVCKKQGRKGDVLGRLGGEEFAFTLMNCDLKAAKLFAEKCRDAIEKIDTSPSGCTFQVTASFGISDSAQSGYELKDLISHADKALYVAKDTGRNRVVLYQPIDGKVAS